MIIAIAYHKLSFWKGVKNSFYSSKRKKSSSIFKITFEEFYAENSVFLTPESTYYNIYVYIYIYIYIYLKQNKILKINLKYLKYFLIVF